MRIETLLAKCSKRALQRKSRLALRLFVAISPFLNSAQAMDIVYDPTIMAAQMEQYAKDAEQWAQQLDHNAAVEQHYVDQVAYSQQTPVTLQSPEGFAVPTGQWFCTHS